MNRSLDILKLFRLLLRPFCLCFCECFFSFLFALLLLFVWICFCFSFPFDFANHFIEASHSFSIGVALRLPNNLQPMSFCGHALCACTVRCFLFHRGTDPCCRQLIIRYLRDRSYRAGKRQRSLADVAKCESSSRDSIESGTNDIC